ncbi:MAG: c-type cytochrome, partial [Phycisphaerales bacterium]|nr:c-type cytochrome [Phycisphaerales bacterium]
LLITAMPIALVFLLALPFISSQGERAPSRRPFAVLSLVLIFTGLTVLSVLGVQSPWSPRMDAWWSDSTPPELLEDRSPLEMAGAVVLQNAQCRNCHSLDGIGGKRGPDLTDVATRLSPEQIVRQIQQGGGNMPAYGRSLNAAETEALTAFLSTLHPANETPAFIPGAAVEELKDYR